MKGFVPTPEQLVDQMVEKLFAERLPSATDLLLDPGCGSGAFMAGVLRWGARHSRPVPRILGIELDPGRHAAACEAFRGSDGRIEIRCADFLGEELPQADYVVGNPPYVSIQGLDEDERTRYRRTFESATGRFDLYSLFFERSLRLLKPGGRLVFVTPEKFMYVQSARALRLLLSRYAVREIELIAESAFGPLVTYPAITTIDHHVSATPTTIVLRSGARRNVQLPSAGESWAAVANGADPYHSTHVITDAFARVSAGVATGADAVFVVRTDELPERLRPFAYPTVSGRGLSEEVGDAPAHWMLVPYDHHGRLLPESRLGALGDYLRDPDRRRRLEQRTCVARKPWYAFHETPPMRELLKPKILCKDIGSRPRFMLDRRGTVVPRHSVYYLVPRNASLLDELCAYLNSDDVVAHLMAHSQRAANGFYRLQSHVLKQVPMPAELVDGTLAGAGAA